MSSRNTRSGRERIDGEPLRHASSSLVVDIEQFSLDEDEEWFEVDKAETQVFLQNWQDDWQTLSLKGTITIDEDLEPVFPSDEWPDGPRTELVIAVKCEYTHLREGRSVPVPDFTERAKPFEISLDSRETYGDVVLTPYVVRTEDAETTDHLRTHAGLELADGPSWTIHIDETDDSSGPLLPPMFKSFEESDNDERFPDDAVYVVDKTDLASPKLYVNRDHEPIATALNSGPRGRLGRVMKVYTDAILLPALSELVIWTAEDVEEDGEPEHDWQQDLLSQIVKKMYDTDSAREAGKSLHEEFRGGGNLPQLLDKTSRTIQQYLEASTDMNNLVDSIRK